MIKVIPPSSSTITALVLSGGRGSRMGGVDKGLQLFRGEPLTLHALKRLQTQTMVPSLTLVNANRHLDAYEAFGAPTCSDADLDFSGPLAGFLAGLKRCETPWLLTVPCDVPHFPLSLCERLAEHQRANQADIAMAAAIEEGRLRTQPVFCLLRTDLVDDLAQFLSEGGRKIDAWTAQHKTVTVPFDHPNDNPNAFANANTLAELRQLESP